MDNQLISLFIDDELTLGEKKDFVNSVRDDGSFADEALALLDLELQLCRLPETLTAALPKRPSFAVKPFSFRDLLVGWYRPVAGFATALLLVALIWPFFRPADRTVEPMVENHRFVFYHPDTDGAKIVGSFTGWQPVEMFPAGDGGYWTVTLPLSPGEHRYSFLVEGGNPIPDPTVIVRELDDFGGENSVLVIGQNHDPVS